MLIDKMQWLRAELVMGVKICAALQQGNTLRHGKNKTQHTAKTYDLKK